jgi:hypothetical protein
MKKKITLILVIIALNNISAFAQILTKTWAVYNSSSGALFKYFHFEDDTLSFSVNNITFTQSATYQENGNNFTIVDLGASACPGVQGNYTFSIQNDTLDFTLVSDTCSSTRKTVIADFYWVSLTTGIPSLNQSTKINIFPNPITNGIVHLNIEENLKHKCLISIFNSNGATVFNEYISTPSTNEINLKNISPGIYLIKVFDGENYYQKKLVVE